jgi:hypothetical protein
VVEGLPDSRGVVAKDVSVDTSVSILEYSNWKERSRMRDVEHLAV